MEDNTNNRPPASAFEVAGSVKMTKDAKINLAMAVYLTLEAINDSAPRGCDGFPCDMMVAHGEGHVSVQELLTKVLGFLRCPVPPLPEPEFIEGRCGCGGKLSSENWN